MLSGGLPATSFLYRLHPLVKVGVASLFTVAALMLGDPRSLGLLLFFFLALFVTSRYRPRGRSLLGGALLLALVGLGNYFASRDGGEAAKYSLRLAVVLLGVPVCAAATPPQQLARALARWRLPPALVVSLLLVWRFFPVLKEEVREIREANRLRGSGRRQEWYRGVLVPLAFVVLEYAERLSLALELRAFDPAAPRTWYLLPRLSWQDGLFAGAAAAVLLAAGVGDHCGWPG